MNENYLYTIRDTKAHQIGNIMVFPNDEVAERAVSLGIKADTMMARCPGDFELVCIGKIDVSTGQLLSDSMRQVALITELVSHE